MRLALTLAVSLALGAPPAHTREPSPDRPDRPDWPAQGTSTSAAWDAFSDQLHARGPGSRRPSFVADRAALDARADRLLLEPRPPPRLSNALSRRQTCDALREALYLGHHGRAHELVATVPRVSEAVALWQGRCGLSDELALSLYRAFGLEARKAPFFITNHAPPRAIIAFDPPREHLPALPGTSDHRALSRALSLPQEAYVERLVVPATALPSLDTTSSQPVGLVTLTLSDPARRAPSGEPATVFERSIRFVDHTVAFIIDRYYCEAPSPRTTSGRHTPRAVAHCGSVTYRYALGELSSITPNWR